MVNDPECHLWCWTLHVNLRRMWVLLLLDEVIYRCPHCIQLSDGAVEFNYDLIFCLLDLCISDRRMLKPLNIAVDLSISPCRSINFYLKHLYFDTILLVNVLRIAISFRRLNSFAIIKFPSLSLRIFLGLQFVLSHMHPATLTPFDWC